MIYLCCPYSHKDQITREARFNLCNIIAARLILQGFLVYSPISHSHPINIAMGNAQTEFEFWRKLDFYMIERCHSVKVIEVDGWETSVGVAEEMRYARSLLMNIDFIRPTCQELTQSGLIIRR